MEKKERRKARNPDVEVVPAGQAKSKEQGAVCRDRTNTEGKSPRKNETSGLE